MFQKCPLLMISQTRLKIPKTLTTSPNTTKLNLKILDKVKYNVNAEASRVLGDSNSGQKPSMSTFNTILFGYAIKNHNSKGAIEWFKKLDSFKLKPDLISFNLVLNGLVYERDTIGAEEWFEKINKYGLEPDNVTYSALIKLHGENKNIKLAVKFYNEMVSKGIKPDVKTYGIMISAYKNAEDYETALNVFQELKRTDLVLNNFIYHMMMDCMRKQGDLKGAVKLYKEMINGNIEADNSIYIVLLKIYNQVWTDRKMINNETIQVCLNAATKMGNRHALERLEKQIEKMKLII